MLLSSFYASSQTPDSAAIRRIGDYGRLWYILSLFHPQMAYGNINQDSLYIHPDNEVELAQAIAKIDADNLLREAMVSRGLEYAKNFSDKNIADHLMKVYHKIC
ncbi:MAG: hypothetical protein EOO88_36460 [Pedobacter sp.]|nr:MAG: hypothetical protein EOO88_36460 [Pedobacter sp.]